MPDQAWVANYGQVMHCDVERFRRFCRGILDRGVYFVPSAFAARFVSAARGKAKTEATLAAAVDAFKGP